MAKYRGPVCKFAGEKARSCSSRVSAALRPKCAFERRGYAPGDHGKGGAVPPQTRIGLSTASCAPSRKLAACMACLNASSTAIMKYRSSAAGITGLNLLQILETRLDNVVFRLGFARQPGRSTPAGDSWSLLRQRPPHRCALDAPLARATRLQCAMARSRAPSTLKTWLLWPKRRMFHPGSVAT